jgi:hypothetical protein
MLANEEQAVAMREARDKLHAALDEHDRTDHGGRRCTANAIGALAYLAHTLGFQHDPAAGWLGYFAELLQEYNELCPLGVGCGHARPLDPADLDELRKYAPARAEPMPGKGYGPGDEGPKARAGVDLDGPHV